MLISLTDPVTYTDIDLFFVNGQSGVIIDFEHIYNNVKKAKIEFDPEQYEQYVLMIYSRSNELYELIGFRKNIDLNDAMNLFIDAVGNDYEKEFNKSFLDTTIYMDVSEESILELMDHSKEYQQKFIKLVV